MHTVCIYTHVHNCVYFAGAACTGLAQSWSFLWHERRKMGQQTPWVAGQEDPDNLGWRLPNDCNASQSSQTWAGSLRLQRLRCLVYRGLTGVQITGLDDRSQLLLSFVLFFEAETEAKVIPGISDTRWDYKVLGGVQATSSCITL